MLVKVEPTGNQPLAAVGGGSPLQVLVLLERPRSLLANAGTFPNRRLPSDVAVKALLNRRLQLRLAHLLLLLDLPLSLLLSVRRNRVLSYLPGNLQILMKGRIEYEGYRRSPSSRQKIIPLLDLRLAEELFNCFHELLAKLIVFF